MSTPTPPETSHSSQASWVTATPHNLRELEWQTENVVKYIKRRTQSPPSPTNQALRQLVKGYQMIMHRMALLEEEIKELRAANAKQKRKRERGRTFIAQEGALRVEEGLDRVQRINEQEREVEEASDTQPRKRAAPRCSMCNTIGTYCSYML
ncbi:hypothetical protein VTO42DRAFT_4756 [Malbranchea cinnamomea]